MCLCHRPQLKEVDLIVGTLETAIGSIGGFCVGTTYIVDHQRLSGLGYCFSASAPPFLARVALHALEQLDEQPQMVAQLGAAAELVHTEFARFGRLQLGGHVLSPVKHLYVSGAADEDREREQTLLRQIVDEVIEILNYGTLILLINFFFRSARLPAWLW